MNACDTLLKDVKKRLEEQTGITIAQDWVADERGYVFAH